jgi:hypothetical protein
MWDFTTMNTRREYFFSQMRLLSIGLKLLIVTKLSACENIAAMHGVVLIPLRSKNKVKRREERREKMCVVIAVEPQRMALRKQIEEVD